MTVEGFVAPGFEYVADEFRRNFSERGEVGAAFAAVRRGEVIVDLWGGVAKREQRRPWGRDTLQVIFSGTKGVVALCLLVLIDRGLVDPDAPVAAYWPEFAAAGKDRVLVREVASHQARLPGIRTPLTRGDVLDDRRMAALLARQPQESDPRAADTYHVLTYGWLCGEIIRRVDGRSVGRFLAEEVAGPLNLEIYIGLPEHLESRVSTLYCAENWAGVSEEQTATDDLAACVLANPPLFEPGLPIWNAPEFHRAEIAGGGGIATARSLARLYGTLANAGEIDGRRLVAPATIALARRRLTRRRDPLKGHDESFGLGFALQTEMHEFGPPEDAFGHGGAGGSIHGAWPQRAIGFSYCMNEMRDDEVADARAQALLHALYRAVDDSPDARERAPAPSSTAPQLTGL